MKNISADAKFLLKVQMSSDWFRREYTVDPYEIQKSEVIVYKTLILSVDRVDSVY